MAFGFKLKTVKTKETFNNEEELFERIKDEKFTAGKPELVEHGFNKVIVFPPLDRQNQGWVMRQGKNKILIQKNQIAGAGNALINEAVTDVTGGVYSIFSAFGGNAKKIEKLVEATAQELEALDL
ncbi:MAG: hypothetical protein PUE02_08740 [Eggerthellaceae bacterium]|nr:hypothetical protein [Eggerthellaceae bacterium]